MCLCPGLCLWPRWCSWRRRARLWGRAAWCARGRRPAREPSAPRASLGASPRSPARPRRHPRPPQPGPPGPPAPSTPVGPCVLTKIHLIAESTPNFACNSPTTLSNPEIRSLELQRFYALLNLHPIELHAKFGGGGLAAAHGHRSLALRCPPHRRGGRNPRLSLLFVGIALLGEALHCLVASALLRYLVHCLHIRCNASSA